MMDPVRLAECKQKYPFLDRVIRVGRGKDYPLFQIKEDEVSEITRKCFVHGSHDSGGEFLCWQWYGMKDNREVDLSSLRTIGESLKNKVMDYLLCEEILTIEHIDHDYVDRSIIIYKIQGEPVK